MISGKKYNSRRLRYFRIFEWHNTSERPAEIRGPCRRSFLPLVESIPQSPRIGVHYIPHRYCSFAYLVLACFRIGMSGSASVHVEKNVWYSLRERSTSRSLR